MKNLRLEINTEVDIVIKTYPKEIHKKISILRKLILEVAHEIEELEYLEETLKWGEPSYLTKNGSTIRIAWKNKTPNQYGIYFKCTSKLVSTFKVVFSKVFNFEGDRAIIFKMDYEVPQIELKKCIRAALTYHKVKNLPQLNIL